MRSRSYIKLYKEELLNSLFIVDEYKHIYLNEMWNEL